MQLCNHCQLCNHWVQTLHKQCRFQYFSKVFFCVFIVFTVSRVFTVYTSLFAKQQQQQVQAKAKQPQLTDEQRV